MYYKFNSLFRLFNLKIVVIFILTAAFLSCSSNKGEFKEEQISIIDSEDSTLTDSLVNSIQGNSVMGQLATVPNAVILTGLADHRLGTIYKAKKEPSNTGNNSYSKRWSEYEGTSSEFVEHYMPGIDILYGYNLLNIAHYDLKSEKLTHFFNTPVLIKTLYYPSFLQDSINKKPINRDYYLLSVYNEDTNKDTLINKKDLRRFFHFDASNTAKTLLIPSDYSVIRSQYDPQNDVMYLFASHDTNKNGTREFKEPIHIFWINLKTPAVAKRLY